MRAIRPTLLAGLLALLIVIGFNHESPDPAVEAVELDVIEAPIPIPVTCQVPCDSANAALARISLWYSTIRWNETIEWNAAVAKAVEAAKQQVRAAQGVKQRPSAAVSAPTQGTQGVIQCIFDHESGDYNESSHPESGSGAAQIIPSTWRTWSVRAGYHNDQGQPTYAYAYQAPPEVQDDVVVFMLTNGGAGNWSPRYGNDPCTVGMGG